MKVIKILVLCGVFLLAVTAPILANGSSDSESTQKRIVIMPGNLGNPYFEACRDGAMEAGEELGVEIIYQGAPQAVAEQQIEVIETLISQRVDGMAISSVDPDALIPVAQKAMKAGIPIVSYDTPIGPAGRHMDVMPANNETIGRQMGAVMAEMIDGQGEVAILSSSNTFFATNEWIRYATMELEKYPDIEIVATVYGEDMSDKSYREAIGLMKSHPNLRGIMSPTSVGVASAGKAIQDEGMIDTIELTGLGLPSEMQEYIKSGACKRLLLWSPVDLGYASVYAVYQVMVGNNTGAKGETVDLGKLGKTEVVDDEGQIFMGSSLTEFNAANIDDWSGVF